MKNNFKDTLKLKCDVLIIGGGGAGLSAAITAKQKGATVIVASKAKVGFANNTYISAGAFSSTGWRSPQDGPEVHLKDTILSGRFINDVNLAEIVARQSHEQVLFLEKCGVDFSKKDKSIKVGLAPGHSFPRNVWGKNSRGSDFMLPLVKYAKDAGVTFLDHTIVTRLFVQGGNIVGAIGFDTEGRLFKVAAKSIVLATGGFARIYQNNNNAPGITGDGHTLAFDVGISLRDMEFVQFYPTYGTLYEVTVARAGARLKNSADEDILDKYGMTDLTSVTRDKLSRAVFGEIHNGLGVDGGVFLDISTVPADIMDRIRGFLPEEASVQDKKMIVRPTAHFCMGGIRVDENSMTTVNGLFGAGEVCGGVHGANRLGGNALSEVFSMGRIAGSQAAEFSKKTGHKQEEIVEFENEKLKLSTLFDQKKGDIKALTSILEKVMWDSAGIIRHEAGLTDAMSKIRQLQVDIQNAGVENFRQLVKLMELKNMVTISAVVCRSALSRTESRGAHYREDYPEENNDKWLCNIVVSKENQTIKVGKHGIDRALLSRMNFGDPDL